MYCDIYTIDLYTFRLVQTVTRVKKKSEPGGEKNVVDFMHDMLKKITKSCSNRAHPCCFLLI